MNRTMLTVSVVDPSGATGLAADMKTFHQWRAYGCCISTGVLCQNTTGAQALYLTPVEYLAQQFDSVFSDIEVHGVKIAGLGSAQQVGLIASLLPSWNVHPLIFDPIVATRNGVRLLDDAALAEVKTKLLPLVDLIVPNMAEAAALTGLEVKDSTGMKAAAKALVEMGVKQAIVTGGGLEGSRAMDVWADAANLSVVDAPRLAVRNTMGLKDALTSSLLCQLARGVKPDVALDAAKKFLAKGMNHPFIIGKGPVGPLNLAVPI